MMRYIHAFMTQVTSTADANSNYSVEQRLARWILMCRDRSETDELHLTHEFLAMMLGVRRPGVTIATHVLVDRT
jgi:CRP-like cAMP-binding protein